MKSIGSDVKLPVALYEESGLIYWSALLIELTLFADFYIVAVTLISLDSPQPFRRGITICGISAHAWLTARRWLWFKMNASLIKSYHYSY